MSAEKPNLDSLFEAAIAIESAEERAAFIEAQCGDDRQLREQLERLLASDAQAGSFLEKSPAELDATLLTDSAAENRAAALNAGLASAFTEGEAVAVGNAGHSVLQSFDSPAAANLATVWSDLTPVVRTKS